MQLSFCILLFCFSILNSCTSEDDTTRKPFEYDLSNQSGTPHYEIMMLSKNNQITPLNFLYDTVSRQIILYAVDYYKISDEGDIIDTLMDVGFEPYPNGILEDDNQFTEWIMTGNKSYFPYNKIAFPNNDIIKKFETDYNNSDFYFRQGGYPTFKTNGEWLQYSPPVNIELMKYLRTEEAKLKYPEKPKGRFIPMPEVGPDLGIPPKERDTSLLKSLGYVAVDVKKENWGLSSHNYSAGFYNMEIYMPGGDTIQFRHFGSLGPDIRLYRVPEKYGGRKDILFVTQDYNYLYPEQSVGGVYVIRPRKL